MLISELKEYIYENGKIRYILEEIGCHHIVHHNKGSKDYYSCANINGDNSSAINVENNRYLNVKNYTREKDFAQISVGFNFDILTLVQYNLSQNNPSVDLGDTIKFLHEILNLPLTINKKSRKNSVKSPLSVFENIRGIKHEFNLELVEHERIDYVPYIHIDWFREGIIKKTVDKFGLAYSQKHRRNIIPLRYWLDGKLLGYNQRTVIKNYEQLGVKKYFITPNYPKNYNLFGLWENRESIKKAKYVVVYESEKSVLKRHSRNDETGVAISGSTVSDEQARILIGLNVDIIISLDKNISIDMVRSICEKFYLIRNVYYTYDKYDLLNEKDSIADASNTIYNYFIKHKVKYDAKEHEKYLKCLKDRRQVEKK